MRANAKQSRKLVVIPAKAGIHVINKYMAIFNKEKNQKRVSDLVSVADILEPLKKQLGIDESFFIVASVWDKEIDPESAQFYGFKDGVVFAQTQYSAVQYDINLRKKDIINKLNQYIGKPAVKDIKVEIK